MSCMYNVHIVIQNWLLVQHECLIHVHTCIYQLLSNFQQMYVLAPDPQFSPFHYYYMYIHMYMYMHIHYIQHVYMYIYNISNMYTCMSADVQVQEI